MAEEEAGCKEPCSEQQPHHQSHALQIGAGITSRSAADLLSLACSPLLDCHSCGPPFCSLMSAFQQQPLCCAAAAGCWRYFYVLVCFWQLKAPVCIGKPPAPLCNAYAETKTAAVV